MVWPYIYVYILFTERETTGVKSHIPETSVHDKTPHAPKTYVSVETQTSASM